MECDSMHSTIERKIVADIFTPKEYVIILHTARIKMFSFLYFLTNKKNYFGDYFKKVSLWKVSFEA